MKVLQYFWAYGLLWGLRKLREEKAKGMSKPEVSESARNAS